jgi:aldose 1-epimerase
MKYWSMFAAACLCLLPGMKAATVTHVSWGQDAAGAPVELYTITSAKAEVKVTTYGAHLVSIRVPNRKGELGNVILGRDSLKEYQNGMGALLGATIGRFANRIDHGQFTLDGKTYQIPTGPNGIALHGGTAGFHTRTWSAKEIRDGVEMTLVSPDGDQGFPGTLTTHVRFTLSEVHGDQALKIQYEATTDKPTIVNFTNHAYFNLADDSSTPVFTEIARIDSDTYTPFDARQIPTGEIVPVAGTEFDFRTAHAIGDKIPARGYDHNWVLRAPSLKAPSVEVEDPASGRTVAVYTTEPALQFFVPRFSAPPAPPAGAGAPPAPPAGAPGAPGGPMGAMRRPSMAAFTLETQHYPDSPNHANFPTTEVRPGKPFESTTIFVFGVKK